MRAKAMDQHRETGDLGETALGMRWHPPWEPCAAVLGAPGQKLSESRASSLGTVGEAERRVLRKLRSG